MILENFTKIIDLYGTKPARWPKRLRRESEYFLADNIEARTLLNQQWQVEEIMKQLEIPSFPGLEARVINQPLPERNRYCFEKLMNWLISDENFSKQVWRSIVAACIPLAFGIVLGNYFSFSIGIEDYGFQYWDDELTMLSFTDFTETNF